MRRAETGAVVGALDEPACVFEAWGVGAQQSTSAPALMPALKLATFSQANTRSCAIKL
jgi:hypothetical protein